MFAIPYRLRHIWDKIPIFPRLSISPVRVKRACGSTRQRRCTLDFDTVEGLYMKPWIIRSGSVVLSAALLAPAAQAYAEQPLPSAAPVQSGPVSAPAGKPLADAAGKAKLSKEAALNIARQLVPEGLELENVSFRSADIWRTFPEWTFIWVKKDRNQNEITFSYTVSIHADSGELTGYSRYEQHPSKPAYTSRVSYAEAQKVAEQFLARHNPAKAAATRLYVRDLPQPKTPLDAGTSYTFRFVRLVDGVPFPDNGADITVSAAGTVTGYTLSWSDGVRFEKPQRMLSAEEAAALFKQHAKAKLSYVLPWDARGEERNNPILAYQNPFSFYLDAGDGTPLTETLAPLKPEAEKPPASGKRLPPRHTGSPLGQDAAVQLAERTFDLSGTAPRTARRPAAAAPPIPSDRAGRPRSASRSGSLPPLFSSSCPRLRFWPPPFAAPAAGCFC